MKTEEFKNNEEKKNRNTNPKEKSSRRLLAQITSGRGPEECSWVCAQVCARIVKEAVGLGISVEVPAGVSNGLFQKTKPGDADRSLVLSQRSILIEFEDTPKARRFLQTWIGTIQWIGKSPMRKNHKRKNWFVGVDYFEKQNDDFMGIPEKELKVETMRSSGAGGQHVNKTESAVRLTHLPTGISAVAQERRSQFANKRLAAKRLLARLESIELQSKKSGNAQTWEKHNTLERGNPVRVFQGAGFKPVH